MFHTTSYHCCLNIFYKNLLPRGTACRYKLKLKLPVMFAVSQIKLDKPTYNIFKSSSEEDMHISVYLLVSKPTQHIEMYRPYR